MNPKQYQEEERLLEELLKALSDALDIDLEELKLAEELIKGLGYEPFEE